MPSCVACAAELERRPSAHPTPSTSRACTASPDRRTTADTTSSGPRRSAGVIAEVRAGAGPVAVMPRE